MSEVIVGSSRSDDKDEEATTKEKDGRDPKGKIPRGFGDQVVTQKAEHERNDDGMTGKRRSAILRRKRRIWSWKNAMAEPSPGTWLAATKQPKGGLCRRPPSLPSEMHTRFRFDTLVR